LGGRQNSNLKKKEILNEIKRKNRRRNKKRELETT
jgi:hypothetical protein